MSRQRLALDGIRDRLFSYHDRVWPRQEILGRDKVFSCRD